MGSVTVGERGQVVIPAEVRERVGIVPGDKLLAFCHPNAWGVMFVKFEKMQQALQAMHSYMGQMATSSGDAETESPSEEGER